MQKCNQCGRVGDDLGKCGSHLTCPGERGWSEVDPHTDVVVGCDQAGCKSMCVTAAAIVHGEVPDGVFTCPAQKLDCKAYVVLGVDPAAPGPDGTKLVRTKGGRAKKEA
jgi:hypothetical protein